MKTNAEATTSSTQQDSENRQFGRSPEAYASLATYVSSIGIFAGAITFAALFQVPCQDEHIPKLLGFSSVLFLGSVLGCVPILIRLHTQRDVDDEGLGPGDAAGKIAANDGARIDFRGRVTEPSLTFIRTQMMIVATLMIGAFICLFLAMLFLSYAGPAFTGFTLILLAIIWSILGYFNIPRSPMGVYVAQAIFLLFVIVVAVVFGARDITGITWTNYCDRTT